jgi:NADH-quinone oxidoreductase subunit J
MSLLLTKQFPIELVCFYTFALLLIISALMVVLSKNPVQSALYLVLAFFASSALWIMAEAEFLGLILVLVYVGAVMTLFLFVVMTVPFDHLLLKKNHWAYTIAGFMIILLFTLLMFKIFTPFETIHMKSFAVAGSVSNTQAIGLELYTQYLFPFELAGLILLVAIIAAITLGVKYNRQKIVVSPADQIKVTAASRLKIIKMASEPKIETSVEPMHD